MNTMKQRLIFLMAVLLMLIKLNGFSQEFPIEYEINREDLEVPALVFSEFRFDIMGKMYVELANVGDTDIDLNKFTIISAMKYSGFGEISDQRMVLRNDRYSFMPLKGTLEPGGVILCAYVYDNIKYNGVVSPKGFPVHNLSILNRADILFHQEDISATEFLNKPEYETYAFDSISNNMFDTDLSTGFLLQYSFTDIIGEKDSTLVDLANIFNTTPTFQGHIPKAIAGKIDAVETSIMVRKTNVKKGNMSWDESIGTDAQNSEWLVVPAWYSRYNAYTTAGTHGDYPIEVSSKRDDIVINMDNETITFPWEIQRGEDVIDYFNVGSGMAWHYEAKGDLSEATVQDGDVITFYAVGNELKQKDFTVKVNDPKENVAVVYSRLYKLVQEKDQGAVQVSYPPVYQVDQGSSAGAVGYINDVPFALRVDSLMANLVMPPNAVSEFMFVDGKDRVDLKQGDKFVVYSKDFSVQKQYVINVDDYVANNNANLASITWPDINLDIYGAIWDDENLPGFSSGSLSYFVLLGDEQKKIPALQFTAADPSATVEVQRATDPDGNIAQRITKVKVIAEDGVTTQVYEITFEKASLPSQPYQAQPYVCEIASSLQSASFVEFYNPGTEPIDLRNYMLLRGSVFDNLKTAVENVWDQTVSTALENRYGTHYVPGMKWQGNTTDEWAEKRGYLEVENTTASTILQPGQTFAIGSIQDGGWPGGRFEERKMKGLPERLDICLRGWSKQIPGTALGDSVNQEFNLNPNGDVLKRDMYPTEMLLGNRPNENALWILHIENDSILLGEKDVTDPDDYIIVDRFHRPADIDTFYAGGMPVGTMRMVRLPHVFEGQPERGVGYGDNNGRSMENSEWIRHTEEEYRDPDFPPDFMGYNISGSLELGVGLGWHVQDRYTGYMSTINSLTMDVTPGYEGELTITDDLSGETVNSITEQIIKNHPEQKLEFIHDDNFIEGNSTVADGDRLKVTSANEQYVTFYDFVNSALSSNNTLVAKDGSELNVSGLIVSGFDTGATLSSVIENLIVPDKALMNIIDQDQKLVPLNIFTFDSVKIETVVSPNISLEVIAENGDVALYSLDFGTASSDAILFSYIFDVNQGDKDVIGVPLHISVDALLTYVFANEDATIKVVDKAGFERVIGSTSKDDKIVVTSEDGTTVTEYTLKTEKQTSVDEVEAVTGSVAQAIVYPNPVSQTLRFKGVEVKHVKVYNMSGHMVMSKTLDSNSLDVSVLKNGMYLIGITDYDNNHNISKFFKN